MIIGIGFLCSHEHNLPHLIAADTFHDQWRQVIIYPEGFAVLLQTCQCFLGSAKAGHHSVVKCLTRDWKVVGLSPCRSCGRSFFFRVSFLCWHLFWYLFHHHVTAVSCKISRHSAKSAGGRLQLNIHAPWVCGFAWSDMTWCIVVWCTQNMPRWQQFQVAPAM